MTGARRPWKRRRLRCSKSSRAVEVGRDVLPTVTHGRDPPALRNPTRCCPGRTPRPPRHRLPKAHASRRARAAGTRGQHLIPSDRKCSADFSAKALICLDPMANSAQVGLEHDPEKWVSVFGKDHAGAARPAKHDGARLRSCERKLGGRNCAFSVRRSVAMALTPKQPSRKKTRNTSTGTPRKQREPRAKPIELYFWPTPNGWKVSIMLEECRLPYNVVPVNISRGEQFTAVLPENLAEQSDARDRRSRMGRAAVRSRCSSQARSCSISAARPASSIRPQERARVAVDEWLFWQMANLSPQSGGGRSLPPLRARAGSLCDRALCQ